MASSDAFSWKTSLVDTFEAFTAQFIALAMMSSMIIAAVAGALVPIVLKRMGQDPALSSAIILTTITDIAGFMSFLSIATLLSGMLATG
jgi:magnesium transporter